MAIPNMGAIEPIEIGELSIVPYSTNVQIFKSTPAVDIPTKLNAVAVDFKNWNNEEIGTKGLNYLNLGVADTVTFLNDSMGLVTNYINTVVVENQNSFISTSTENYEQFKIDMQNNIGQYLDDAGAGYSLEQVNELRFTGDTILEFDEDGNLTRYGNGAFEKFDIVYTDGEMSNFKEKIIVGSATFTKEFNVSHDTNNNIIITEVE